MAKRRQTRQSIARAWRSRITGHGEAAPTQLLPHPKNWRLHSDAQGAAVSGALDQVGWVRDVIVNTRTGHLVDGHLRVALAIEAGQPLIPVVFVELDEAEEALVLATLDPLSAMALQDDSMLGDLLAEVDADGALGALVESLTGASEAWETTADFGDAHLVTQADVDRRAAQLGAQFRERGAEFQEGYVELVCTHCGETFAIRGEDLEKDEVGV